MIELVEKQIGPSKIMQVGMGFWASKTLLAGVNMELFTLLAKGELSGGDIKSSLDLHDRSLYDFLDTLVALGFLERSGLRETALYSNSEDTNLFLDKNKPTYCGGILELANNRLYPNWNYLEDGLKTGLSYDQLKPGAKPLFEDLYSSPERLTEFLRAMGALQMGNFNVLSNEFDFSNYTTLCDIGGAGGHLSIQVASNNLHMKCNSFDLAPVTPITIENIKGAGLEDKVVTHSGDFFKEEFPKADVITMGNILHDWGTEDKKMLIQKAYNALPIGGSLIVIENIIDDNRCENAFGLMMSLNMLVETSKGYDFSAADFKEWADEIGFKETYSMPLTGPSSAVIALK
jgi:precorrin-6B methylase 2